MIIGILLLALGGGAVALHSVYTVRTVYVEGNVHYTEDEIMEIVMSGPLGDKSTGGICEISGYLYVF